MRPPPARRHLDPAGAFRIAPWLVAAGAALVGTCGVVAIIATAVAPTAKAAATTTERAAFTPRELPELRVPRTSATTSSPNPIVVTSEDVAPQTTLSAPRTADNPVPGVPGTPHPTFETPSASQPVEPTTPPVATTPAATTQPPSPTTVAPTTNPAATTAPTPTTEPVTTAPTPTEEPPVTTEAPLTAEATDGE